MKTRASLFLAAVLLSPLSMAGFTLNIRNTSSDPNCDVSFYVVYYYHDNSCSSNFSQIVGLSGGGSFTRPFVPNGDCTGNSVYAATVQVGAYSTDNGSTYHYSPPYGTVNVPLSDTTVLGDCSGFQPSSPPPNDPADGLNPPRTFPPSENVLPSLFAPSGCVGMPTWSVSEPYISLWLQDEPLGYQPALGPRISFQLAFKQRELTSGLNTNFFSTGKKWNCSWFSFVSQDPNTNNVVHMTDGREITYNGTNDFITNTRLTGDTTNGFTLAYPDGSQDIYGFIVTNSSGKFQQAFLTQRKNPQAQKISLNYYSYLPSAPVIRLTNVVDGDGRTNLIYYNTTNAYSTNLISVVVDAFGRSNSLAYDSSGHLTNSTDVAGISSSFAYDTNDWVTNMTTPYGTNSFTLTDTTGTNLAPNGRSVLVTQPDGSHHLYLYTNGAPGVASSYSTNQIPITAPFTNNFDTNSLDVRDSFHWGPRQYANLSTTNVGSFTNSDFRLARMQHWLSSSPYLVNQTLSMERDSSPDSLGSIEGQKTWYDYAGKTNTQYEGTQVLPLFIAQVLPDGTTSFGRDDRNPLGNVLTNIGTYSSNNIVALRTNIYAYDSIVGIDLITVTKALGVQVSSNSYNAYHEVTTNYDGLNQATLFTYNANLQVSGVAFANGLVSTNIYESDGWLATNYSYASGPVYFGTNIFTYGNDLVLTHTDARGLTTTNSWDNLQRLTKVLFPDGTFITNTYSILDLVQTVDRMGFTNLFQYDSMRRLITQTNALGNVTSYNYCSCGALDSVRDAMGNTNYFYYDNLGQLTGSLAPDGYSVTNYYNSLGQLTNSADSGGVSVTNWFNNQGLQYAASNYFGQVFSNTVDILDRTTNSMDANGVMITNTYDNLNRILTRTYPDTGVEQFLYSAKGLVAYTNQLNFATRYDYDAAGRKLTETNANLEVTHYSNSPAGDLLTLTDGKNQTTTWNYDIFGNVSNKVDAANNVVLTYHYDNDQRLTNRYSITKGNTYYYYDKVGNLTNTTYNVSPSISLAYDALNRLTSMIDGVGTTGYSYDSASELLSEDGPWANDTMGYTYTNRLRGSLSLLQPNGDAWTQTYGYDGARRLTNTISSAGIFAYAYDPTRQTQVKKLTLPNTAYITNSYDSVVRLTGTTLENSTNGVLNYHGYTYNLGGQRTQQVFTKNNYVNYTYDNIGQLATALGKEATGGTNRLHEQMSYGYDAAHNLNFRTNNALVQTFNVNNLNELSNVTRNVTNVMTVAGTTSSLATNVAVNGVNAARYADATFASTNGFTLTNGNNTFTAIAGDSKGRHDTNSVTVNLPATNNYTYDLNGNLLSDGMRAFDYDDENELIRVTVTNAWKSEFTYDGKMRMRVRKEFTWSGSWVQTNEVHYIYSGNAVIQERDGINLPKVTYTRGISGLLARTDMALAIYNRSATSYYHPDGHGNITAMINGQQVMVAKYQYDPYGNILSQSGSLADANVYRFSSREYHANSGLICYLRRFYDPSLQRWLNRDPIGEQGGANLFAYVGNNPVSVGDYLGMCPGLLSWLDDSIDNMIDSISHKFDLATETLDGLLDPHTFNQTSLDISFGQTRGAFNLAMDTARGLMNTSGDPLANQAVDTAFSFYSENGNQFINNTGTYLGANPNSAATQTGSTSATITLTAASLFLIPGGDAGAAAGGGDITTLFHGTDLASAQNIVANGINRSAARALGGGDVFWATSEKDLATLFAKANPIGGQPAVVSFGIPTSGLNSMIEAGSITIDRTGAYMILDWEGFNQTVVQSSIIK